MSRSEYDKKNTVCVYFVKNKFIMVCLIEDSVQVDSTSVYSDDFASSQNTGWVWVRKYLLITRSGEHPSQLVMLKFLLSHGTGVSHSCRVGPR